MGWDEGGWVAAMVRTSVAHTHFCSACVPHGGEAAEATFALLISRLNGDAPLHQAPCVLVSVYHHLTYFQLTMQGVFLTITLDFLENDVR